MKCLAIGLNVVAFLLGMAAAWFWLKASLVNVQDPYPRDGISRPTETSDFMFPTIDAFKENARWNKMAALFTGMAVFIGALGNLAGQWPIWPFPSN